MARIVIIDDRITNRNILTRLAQSVEEGLMVESFAAPLDALKALAVSGPPDLVITDFNMPDLNGAELIQRLRAMPGFETTLVIVVTVYEDREYCYRALEAGATDFLLSPVDHLEFRARVRNLLTIRRQQLQLLSRASELEERLLGAGRDGLGPVDPITLCAQLELPAFLTDRNSRLVAANRAWGKLVGISEATKTLESLDVLLGEELALRHRLQADKVLETGRAPRHPELITLERDGERRLLVAHSPVHDAAGTVGHVLTVWHDVDELWTGHESGNAGFDVLTGLPGREAMHDRLHQEIAHARASGGLFALIHVDIDRFKGFNDAFGDMFGDALLRAVSGRLRSRLKETDALGRLRSDELLILHPGLRRPDEAGELCRRLGEAFAEPFRIGEREVNISASMGVTVYPADATDAEALLKNAELAMYRAKQQGRDTWRFFAAEMNVSARHAIQLERELRQALAGRQFIVYYQPQLDLRTDRIVGMEALVRWNHPQRGLVMPGEFLKMAEHIGLIAPLSNWVFQEACRQLRAWQDRGIEGLKLSVNLSPVQFKEHGIEQQIEQLLKQTGVNPHLIDIELTENALFENTAQAMSTMRYLSRLGVSLSLDDFGTGYSSLAYLQRLPVHRLKIDRQFVLDLEESAQSRRIVHMICELARALGLSVLAEGVETQGQREHLARIGCDEIQGHLISFPVPAEEFERLVLEPTVGGRIGLLT